MFFLTCPSAVADSARYYQFGLSLAWVFALACDLASMPGARRGQDQAVRTRAPTRRGRTSSNGGVAARARWRLVVVLAGLQAKKGALRRLKVGDACYLVRRFSK